MGTAGSISVSVGWNGEPVGQPTYLVADKRVVLECAGQKLDIEFKNGAFQITGLDQLIIQPLVSNAIEVVAKVR